MRQVIANWSPALTFASLTDGPWAKRFMMFATVASRHSFVPPHAVTAVLDQAMAALRVWRKTRLAAEELALMDDRQLADVGFTRREVYRIANGLSVDR